MSTSTTSRKRGETPKPGLSVARLGRNRLTEGQANWPNREKRSHDETGALGDRGSDRGDVMGGLLIELLLGEPDPAPSAQTKSAAPRYQAGAWNKCSLLVPPPGSSIGEPVTPLHANVPNEPRTPAT